MSIPLLDNNRSTLLTRRYWTKEDLWRRAEGGKEKEHTRHSIPIVTHTANNNGTEMADTLQRDKADVAAPWRTKGRGSEKGKVEEEW